MKMQRAFILAALCAVASAAPTTFPYENESMVPPSLLEATPSNTFDDSDPGGYHYYYVSILDLNTVELPFCGIMTGCNNWALVVQFGAPAELADEVASWNCSMSGFLFAAGDFTGVVAGSTVCSTGSCCQEFFGEPKYGDDQMEWHTSFDDLVTFGLCGDISEALYCNFVNGHYQNNCIDRWTTNVERVITFPCPDVHMRFWLGSCSVYKSVPLAFGIMGEPDSYIAACNFEEHFLAELFVTDNDHICHPHSFYNPEASTSSTTSSTESAASAASTSDSSDVGSTAAFHALSFALCGLLTL